MKEVDEKVIGEETEIQMNNEIDENKVYLFRFEAVNIYKSVGRAYRRGLISQGGTVYPKRPFNNRKSSNSRGVSSRKQNDLKKEIYGKYKETRRILEAQGRL